MDGIITPTIQERKNKMGEVWFSSDLHLGHQKEFLYVPRGFSSIEEHDEAIIDNINEVVALKTRFIFLATLCWVIMKKEQENYVRFNVRIFV